MPLIVNLRHLEAHDVRLQGEMAVAELDIETRDEVVQLGQPLQYDIEVQKLDKALLLQGRLCLPLNCECVRCLKRFAGAVELRHWTCHLPLEGEEAVAVANDCVDLTPYVREDILLEFPQHPLCDPECRGLPELSLGRLESANGAGQAQAGSAAWVELNKLRF